MNPKMNIDLNKYKQFVEQVTSLESNDTDYLTQRLIKLEQETNVNIALLLTCLLYTSPSPRD